MSKTPKNKTYPQAVLYHAGERHIGADQASLTPDHIVRREGAKHLGVRAAVGTAAVGLLLGAGVQLGKDVDRSPTMRPYLEKDKQDLPAPGNLKDVPPDPKQTVIDVQDMGNSEEIEVHVQQGEHGA